MRGAEGSQAGGSAAGVRGWVAIALLFVVSRAILAWCGVTFGTFLLFRGWQSVDPDLLRDRLVETLWHLHAQPPLFNLGLGLVYRWFPEAAWIPVLHALYLGMGLLLSVGLLSLAGRVLRHSWLAWLVTGLFILSPGCIVTENFLYYEYPCCLALVWTALFLSWFEEGHRFRHGLLACLGMAVVVLLRSLFHLIWFAGCLLLIWFFLVGRRRPVGVGAIPGGLPGSSGDGPGTREAAPDPGSAGETDGSPDGPLKPGPLLTTRSLTLMAVLPALLVGGWFLKNLVLFGFFGSSSWFGMNLWRIAHFSPDVREIQAVRDSGALSPVTAFAPFNPLPVYRPFIASSPAWGIPVLDREFRSCGDPNLNHRAYLEVASHYRRDALTLIRRFPFDYLMSVAVSLECFSLPATDYGFYRQNRQAMAAWDDLYNFFIYGMWREDADLAWLKRAFPDYFATSSAKSPMLVQLLYPSALLLVLLVSFGVLPPPRSRPLRFPLTLAFLAGTALYVAVVSSTVEIGENQRFRILVEPFFLLLVAAAAELGWGWARPLRNSPKMPISDA